MMHCILKYQGEEKKVFCRNLIIQQIGHNQRGISAEFVTYNEKISMWLYDRFDNNDIISAVVEIKDHILTMSDVRIYQYRPTIDDKKYYSKHYV